MINIDYAGVRVKNFQYFIHKPDMRNKAKVNFVHLAEMRKNMIALYELQQFVAFADVGTLSEAADFLNLSQPALSRNMKKLEDNLGVMLFVRRKNKLELNDNGKYLLSLAKTLLADADSLTAKVRDFDRKKHTIALGVCAPAPIWRLVPVISNIYPHMTLQTEIDDSDHLLSDLGNNVYQLVVVHQKPDSTAFYFRECCHENLLFALPKGHRYARRKSLSFAEMNGENMLLMSNIGFWDFVRTEKMPDSRFLMQNDRFSFNELVQTSSLPSFITDLSPKYLETAPGRIHVPISDKEASVTYYLVCTKDRKKEFMPLFSAL